VRYILFCNLLSPNNKDTNAIIFVGVWCLFRRKKILYCDSNLVYTHVYNMHNDQHYFLKNSDQEMLMFAQYYSQREL
jgi:hypothetical protein